jgi:glycosyltransferase involved in cell wall biosynthesis
MKTTIKTTSLRTETNFNLDGTSHQRFISTFSSESSVHYKVQIPEILFITSFPSRECGIASYSQDLIHALQNKFGTSFICSVCALETDNEKPVYNEKPMYVLNTDQPTSFLKTAFAINRNRNIQLVVIQHEFGFFMENESTFYTFIESLDKPIVFVFHTVLPHPSFAMKAKVEKMAAEAESIVVMTQLAAHVLTDEYAVPAQQIQVIPHGTHLVPPSNKETLKANYYLSGRKVLSTFGLLSSGKAIEVTLEGLPPLVKTNPEIVFLVLGKTHPSIFKNEGEKYRLFLEEKVKSLGLSNHVLFVNEYLSLPVLLEYLQLTDIYLFTSNDPNQAVSGTFSYAVSCGCPIVSTPIPHAKEVLGNGVGLMIDFGNSEQLTKAVSSILNDDEGRKRMGLNAIHKMAPTAWENSAIAHAKLFEKLTEGKIKLQYKIPEVKLDHIKRMTNEFGMYQFAQISQPDPAWGYTLDDNARALLALCQHYERSLLVEDLERMEIYLGFLEYCLQNDGKFLNYVDFEQEFTGQNFTENLEDSNGRAIWALGYLLSIKSLIPRSFFERAESIFNRALPNLRHMHSTRAMAFVIKGLYYHRNLEHTWLIEILADRLVQMYRHEKKEKWMWFEASLSYGNSIVPEALLCAFHSTGSLVYKAIAKESFDFLLSKLYKNGQISVPTNLGRYVKNHKKNQTQACEQPIDVAYIILALEKFYTVFGERIYAEKALLAFNWFLGENHLGRIIYNPCTGGCYDGLEDNYINLNQGAESTLSYLLARLAIERMQDINELGQLEERKILGMMSLI